MTLELTPAHRLAIATRLGDGRVGREDVVAALFRLGGTDVEIGQVVKMRPESVRRVRVRLGLRRPGPTPMHGGKLLALVLWCLCEACEERRRVKNSTEASRRQEKTLPTARKQSNTWTATDDEVIMDTLHRPVAEVAKRLGRTANSVIQRRARLRGNMTPEVREFALRAAALRDEGLSLQQIGDALGATKTKVARVLQTLELVREVSEMPARRHARWTAEEDAELLESEKTSRQLADEMGRSYGSVKVRRAALRRASMVPGDQEVA